MLKNYKPTLKKDSKGQLHCIFIYTGSDPKKSGHQYTFIDGALYFKDKASTTPCTLQNNYGWSFIDQEDYRYHIFWNAYESAIKGGDTSDF